MTRSVEMHSVFMNISLVQDVVDHIVYVNDSDAQGACNCMTSFDILSDHCRIQPMFGMVNRILGEVEDATARPKSVQ